MRTNTFFIAGSLSLAAALAHLAIIFGGPSWYRFFGAGEHMANMAEQGQIEPTLITLSISAVLAIWAAYAWSAAELLPRLPLLKLGLLVITAIYLVRGTVGLVAPFISTHPQVIQNSLAFWIWSSLICLILGFIHLKGVIEKWFT